MKIFIIIALVGFLIYLIARRFMLKGSDTAVMTRGAGRNFVIMDTTPQLIRRVTGSTLRTVGIGFILLIIALVLGMKIKILWILVPLSLYLIGQLFVYTNHVRTTKDQRIYFNLDTYQVLIDYLKEDSLSFNLIRDVDQVSEVRSVQKNRGTLFGYYKLRLKDGPTVVIPYLIEQNNNQVNTLFFKYLNENYKIEVEKRLFPII